MVNLFLLLLGADWAAYNRARMTEHDHGGLLTDEALLHNIAHGCEDCFDLLFLRFLRPVLNLAYKILRDRPEAEDVVQEVFLAIHRQREKFDPSVGSARTWVLQFAYYKSLKRRRFLSSRHFYDQHTPVDDTVSDPLLVHPEFVQRSLECREIVERALAGLTPGQRRVVELLHFEGQTLREISKLEGRELTSVRNSYYRGIKAMRMAWARDSLRADDKAAVSARRKEEYEIEL